MHAREFLRLPRFTFLVSIAGSSLMPLDIAPFTYRLFADFVDAEEILSAREQLLRRDSRPIQTVLQEIATRQHPTLPEPDTAEPSSAGGSKPLPRSQRKQQSANGPASPD